ncbi:hypothetical protein V2P20_03555 [Methylobacter sp. Wu1]|uniref:hypothetical protein n=1 Tax=Methylobacter sp. Wu1 TaxID=3119359 RepID=UPI002F95F335
MNNDELKREAIYIAAALARGDGLSVLYRLCETQKTISTKKVLEHIERTHEFMKDCAAIMVKLERELPNNAQREGRDAK